MGLKIDSSHDDVQLSKMEVAIENITFHAAVGNLSVNQLMEREAAAAIKAKATSTEDPKCTTMITKNVRQVVSQVLETLANTPKHEERKFNPRLTGLEAKEGETEKELVQRLNTELLQGQMKLCAKVVTAMRQWPAIARASASAISARHGVVLLKFATNEDRHATLRRRKGLAGTTLNLDEDLTPAQQARKSKLWPLFKHLLPIRLLDLNFRCKKYGF